MIRLDFPLLRSGSGRETLVRALTCASDGHGSRRGRAVMLLVRIWREEAGRGMGLDSSRHRRLRQLQWEGVEFPIANHCNRWVCLYVLYRRSGEHVRLGTNEEQKYDSCTSTLR
jgi:hypothetical protein